MFKLTRLMATKLTHRVLLKILSTSSNSRSGSVDGEKGGCGLCLCRGLVVDPATERPILVDEEETQPPANWLPITVSPRGDSSPELDFGDQRVIVPVARPKRRKAQKEKDPATERPILVDEEETEPPANWLPITVSSSPSSSGACLAHTDISTHALDFLTVEAQSKPPPKRQKKETTVTFSTGTQTISTGEIIIKTVYTENL